jgi:lysophospholipase L1-like esterase
MPTMRVTMLENRRGAGVDLVSGSTYTVETSLGAALVTMKAATDTDNALKTPSSECVKFSTDVTGGIDLLSPSAIGLTGWQSPMFSSVPGMMFPPSLYKIRAAIGRQSTGGSAAKIVFLGDSTTMGELSDATLANYRPNSFPAKLASLLTATGVSSAMTNAFGNGGFANGTSVGYVDSRLSGTGSAALLSGSDIGAGGLMLGVINATGVLSFAPGATSDTVDIYYLDSTGVFTVNVDGGATLSTVTMTATNTVKKVTVSYTAGVRTVNVVWVSGSFFIGGFNCYTLAAKTIQLLNLGSGGSTAVVLAGNAAYAPKKWIELIAPDLTVISLGINDWIAGNSQAAFSAALQTLITSSRISGDVVLMTPFPSATSQASLASQAAYCATVKALAISNGIQCIDENANLVSKSLMTTNGLGSDANHPNGLGYAVIAADIRAWMRQIC